MSSPISPYQHAYQDIQGYESLSDIIAEILRKYGPWTLVAAAILFIIIWIVTHFMASPGGTVSVLWGAVEYTKDPGVEEELREKEEALRKLEALKEDLRRTSDHINYAQRKVNECEAKRVQESSASKQKLANLEQMLTEARQQFAHLKQNKRDAMPLLTFNVRKSGEDWDYTKQHKRYRSELVVKNIGKKPARIVYRRTRRWVNGNELVYWPGKGTWIVHPGEELSFVTEIEDYVIQREQEVKEIDVGFCLVYEAIESSTKRWVSEVWWYLTGDDIFMAKNNTVLAKDNADRCTIEKT